MTTENLKSYIAESASRPMRETTAMGGTVQVVIKDPLPTSVKLDSVLQQLEKVMPPHFWYNCDSILIGQFDELDAKQVQAAYMDGAIYVTNDQSSEEDLFDDVIHEFAHSVEDMSGAELYADGELEREFLVKRNNLFNILSNYGYNKVDKESYLDVEYSEKFDAFLHQTVGYERLALLTADLFVSPYGATSLSEYFANGFEHYFLGKAHIVKELSPVLYNKLSTISAQESF